jgi:lipopolysaccharide/colanic/teichoic acid biosynthesis glycosyltransferase
MAIDQAEPALAVASSSPERGHDLAAAARTTPRWVSAARRVRDVTGALVALLLLAPVMAVIALAIRLDSPGPALFRQRRLGRGMRPFTVLKFRTMRADCDAAPHRAYVATLIDDDGDGAASRAGLFKLTGDDRITAIGGVLRRWSLDELPQLFNVLRGDMSLVGPRPVIPYEVDRYPDWYFGRFGVRPGLTGLWQVSGRNERTYEEMVRFDVEYAAGSSLRGDAAILAKTVWVVLARRGAA